MSLEHAILSLAEAINNLAESKRMVEEDVAYFDNATAPISREDRIKNIADGLEANRAKAAKAQADEAFKNNVALLNSNPVTPPAPTETVTPPAPTETVTPPAPTETVTPPAPTETVTPPAPTETVTPPAPTETVTPPAPVVHHATLTVEDLDKMGAPKNDVELDANGLPWDDRIHSSGRTQLSDGTWRLKRGVPDAEREAVEKELKDLLAIPTPAAPEVPPSPEAIVDLPSFIKAITTAGLDADTVNAALKKVGVGSATDLMLRQDLIPSVASELGL